ncbi:DUF2807 domain-containing protein [Candidatus Parcubacteria bacterium]|jgi:hypothetical protein|nr:DUF2807 domain-containing protein [Candidatus Parcubacteria bacterium]MBT3949132.1 DUF2807 domain-containing protein [Candidatus Parcubacteria bacterium]
MRRFLFLSLGIIAFALVLSGGGCSFLCTNGSGTIVSEEREVPIFNAVHLRGSGNVYVTQGEEFYVKVQTDDNLLEEVVTRVQGDMLIIEKRDESKCIKETDQLKIWVTMPEVKGLGISGSGSIRSENALTSMSDDLDMVIEGSGSIDLNVDISGFDMHIDGSGTLRVGGKAGYANFNVNGSGKYFGFHLKSDSTKININGSGKAEVGITKELDINIAGSGDIYYKGNPKITQDVSGSGSVEAVDDEEDIGKQVLEAIDTMEDTNTDVPIENSCEVDADCACGIGTMVSECFYGNDAFVVEDSESHCPDFCSGIAGNLEIKCVKNRCEQIKIAQ